MRVLILALVFSVPLVACECAQLTPCWMAERPVIFIGEVIDGGVTSLKEDPWYSDAEHVRFRVIEAFRGVPAGTETIEVLLFPPGGMCSPVPYFSGKRYLVSPHESRGALWDGPCFSGQHVERAGEEIQFLRDYFAGRMPVNIHGRVATGSDYRLSDGRAKPLSGVTVTALRGEEVYSTTSDADGNYFIVLPGAGLYQLTARLDPYTSKRDDTLIVPPSGCVIAHIEMSTANTVSGRVATSEGVPVARGEVGLIDIESPRDAPVVHLATSRDDGSYLFQHVPLGRYVLAVNPHGPSTRSPFETAYYPNAGSRDDALIIDILDDETDWTGMDLVVGRRVEFRRVRVSASFADGATMQTARIECNGAPVEPRQPGWSAVRGTGKDGVVEFEAPANLSLRISLKDAYGRDLGQEYVAEFDAGASPVEHEFVVTP